MHSKAKQQYKLLLLIDIPKFYLGISRMLNMLALSKSLPLRTGGGEGLLVTRILLYLPRYKTGWFNKGRLRQLPVWQ